MNKDFEFKKLINKKGFFCKISYEIDITEEKSLSFECLISDSKWYGALLFGANYFYERYSLFRNKGIRIIVKKVEGQIVDTSNVVVLFTIVKLLCEETHFTIDGFELNEYGNLILPK